MFNVIFPEVVESLRATEYDCFHNNDKVQLFIDKVMEAELSNCNKLNND
jgi:hypothetical protein